MAEIDQTSWLLGDVSGNPFAHPRGVLGRLAALAMRIGNGRSAREVAAALPLRPGQQVLEVGFGSGMLLRALAARPEKPRLIGVEPSQLMLGRGRRTVPAADLRLGTAANTGLPAASVDHVVSVNTVAIWPDLDAGLDELRRVLREGSTLLIGWHRGAGAHSRASRPLGLAAEALDRIESGLRARFTRVSRTELTDVVVFRAS